MTIAELKQSFVKRSFVENELTKLLRKIDNSIENASYETKESGEEIVTVNFILSSGVNAYKKINVTADSLAALTRDVLQQID